MIKRHVTAVTLNVTWLLLLFLLPPSCIVVPIGNTANKFNFPLSFSSIITSNSQQSSLPTVYPTSSIGMDKSSGTSPDNNVKVRGRNFSTQTNLSRDILMSSTHSSVIYHERMMANNGMDINSDLPTDSSALSYETEQEKLLCFSKVAETLNNMRPQNRNNMAPHSNWTCWTWHYKQTKTLCCSPLWWWWQCH